MDTSSVPAMRSPIGLFEWAVHATFVIASVMLASGCTPSATEIEQMSAASVFADKRVMELAGAAEKGDVDAIDALVKDGVDVNSKGRYNVTPLFRSLVARNKKGFEALLRHGANPNVLNIQGFAVVNEAALDEDPYWLEQALKHGGNPNLINEGNPFSRGKTPIYYAISKARTANAKLLIAAKADVNHKDATGSCPLLRAAQMGEYETVYALLEAGADFRQRDKAGDDLVSWVSRRNEADFAKETMRTWFLKTVDLLKEKGAEFEPAKE
jgi:ankyrin repeat protein